MSLRENLEINQVWIYIVTLILAFITGVIWAEFAENLSSFINLILGILMYGMFTQIPFFKLKESISNRKFIIALIVMNFLIVPIIVWILTRLLPADSSVLLGVLLVLLTPCIDYVIVFTQLGKGDEKLMLVSTPLLFIIQMITLPLYLWMFMGKEIANIIHVQPFIESFIYLILIPLIIALITQLWSKKSKIGERVLDSTAWLPVPFMSFTLFIIVASQINKVLSSSEYILQAIPIYVLFMIMMPLIAKIICQLFKLGEGDGRTLVFSSSTRNSLVVLVFALALPEPLNHIVSAVIVTQTIVEIIGELFYIKLVPKLIRNKNFRQ